MDGLQHAHRVTTAAAGSAERKYQAQMRDEQHSQFAMYVAAHLHIQT
jgi:hypothetical protein